MYKGHEIARLNTDSVMGRRAAKEIQFITPLLQLHMQESTWNKSSHGSV